MSAVLPACSGTDAVRALKKAGWVYRQHGSHVILKKGGSRNVLSVPQHPTLAKGTLRKLINLSGLAVDEFKNLL